MRSHGVAASAHGLGLSDHLCWTFGSEREHRRFRAAAVDFARDGLRLGQRVVYVVAGDETTVPAEVAALGDLPAMRDTRPVVVVRRPTSPRGGEAVARDSVARAMRWLDEAITDGFRGLRVVSDSTASVAEPAAHPHHLALEQSIDRHMAGGRPCAALCGYDRRTIGDDAAAALACVHPLRHDPTATFSLFADGTGVCLAGEIDVVQAPWFEQALATLPDRRELVIDATGLRFVDAAGLAVLARFAERRPAGHGTFVVRGTHPVVPRMWALLGFSRSATLRFT